MGPTFHTSSSPRAVITSATITDRGKNLVANSLLRINCKVSRRAGKTGPVVEVTRGAPRCPAVSMVLAEVQPKKKREQPKQKHNQQSLMPTTNPG